MLEAILSFLQDGHYYDLIRTELEGLFRDSIIRFHLITGYYKGPTFLNLNMLDLRRVPRKPQWGPLTPTILVSFGIVLRRLANGPEHWPGVNHPCCSTFVDVSARKNWIREF